MITHWVRYGSGSAAETFGRIEGNRIQPLRGAPWEGADPCGSSIPLASVHLLAPCMPRTFIALWNNFRALAEKLGKSAPSHPLYLIKASGSLIGPGEAIRRPAGYKGKIAFEGELAIVIGRRCRNVSPAQAEDCIFGYTCANDITAIEVMNENPDFVQWCRAKSFDTFGAIGPVIASGLDWRTASVVTLLDGRERQRYAMSDMIFPPQEIVSRISHDMTLLPGDVIACGTSVGVGSIPDGATVSVAIEGIGTLVNTLVTGGAAQT